MRAVEKGLTKHQLKSEATRIALLEAAQEIFARDGYERAQIDEIAKQSGRTRGAVYSQYKTKEQLFFAVQEQRMQLAADTMRSAIEKSPENIEKSLKDLKDLYANLDHSDADILDLELKLYAVRNPECRQAWREHYATSYSADHTGEFKTAFGVSEQTGRSHIRNRVFALAAVKSGLILAMRFMPQELSQSQTTMLLREIFDGLFAAPEVTRIPKLAKSLAAKSQSRSGNGNNRKVASK